MNTHINIIQPIRSLHTIVRRSCHTILALLALLISLSLSTLSGCTDLDESFIDPNQPAGTITATPGDKPGDNSADTRTTTQPTTGQSRWAVGDRVTATHTFDLPGGKGTVSRIQTLTCTAIATSDTPATWTTDPTYVYIPAGATGVDTQFTFEATAQQQTTAQLEAPTGIHPDGRIATSDPEQLIATNPAKQSIDAAGARLTARPTAWSRPGSLIQITDPTPGHTYLVRIYGTPNAPANATPVLLRTLCQKAPDTVPGIPSTSGSGTLDFHLLLTTLSDGSYTLHAQITDETNPLSILSPYELPDALKPGIHRALSAYAITYTPGDPQAPVTTVLNANYPLDAPENSGFDPAIHTWIIYGGGSGTPGTRSTRNGGTPVSDAIVCDRLTQALDALPAANPVRSLVMMEVETLTDSVFKMRPIAAFTAPQLTSVGVSMFFGCTNLTTVNLPRVQYISSYAFNRCTSLTTTDLPQAAQIGQNSFVLCTSLTTINLPQVQEVMGGAFYNCTSLTTINLPEAKIIAESAFTSCSNLTTINLPKAQKIADFAFFNCSKLTTLNLPEVRSIRGSEVFANCSSLTTIELTAGGDFSLNGEVFQNFDTKKCTLKLNADKKSDGDGWPRALPQGTLWGVSGLEKTWKVLAFTDGTEQLPVGGTEIDGEKDFTAQAQQLLKDGVKQWIITGGGDNGGPKDQTLNANIKTALNAEGLKENRGAKIELTLSDLTRINESTFIGCLCLNSITAPKVTHIGTFGFFSCQELETLILPKAIDIASGATSDCGKLKRLELTAAGTITLVTGSIASDYASKGCVLKLNSDKKPGGSGRPTVQNGNEWGGKDFSDWPVTWTSPIEYTE